MGGDCLNVGCVPSKAIISAAQGCGSREASRRVRRQRAGWGESSASRRSWSGCAACGLQSAPTIQRLAFGSWASTSSFGSATFLGLKQRRRRGYEAGVHPGGYRHGRTGRCASDTGIGFGPLPHERDRLFSLTELPFHARVSSAPGRSAAEMAQAFAQLGSRCTWSRPSMGVLPREDREAAAIVEQAMIADGVNLLCCGKAASCHHRVTARSSFRWSRTAITTTSRSISCWWQWDANRTSRIWVWRKSAWSTTRRECQGRRPTCAPANRRIYAAGDICSPYQFTHAADFMARIVIQNCPVQGPGKVLAADHPLVHLHLA